jgi:diadenosine tetraphosphatase ApaH/serine/threonine PP2A family protein phosphatase
MAAAWNISALEAALADPNQSLARVASTADELSSLRGGRFLKVDTSFTIQDGWQLVAGAQVNEEGRVEVEKGEQSLLVNARRLLQLNADLPALPLPNLAHAAAALPQPRSEAKEVYSARHPHVEGKFMGDDVESAATDHVVLRENVSIGSMKVAAVSWRGAHVEKSCCAFKLASHFISCFQRVCLDASVPVASQAFTAWLSANSRALVGSESDLRQLVAPYASKQPAGHVSDFAAAVGCLTEECVRLLKLQPMLVRARGPAKVYGDIHGQLADLLALFREHGFPSNRSGGDVELVSYIFDGDFVDRGPQQVEVVLLLFSLKVAFPDRVFLLRGNHEFREMNESSGYGFNTACAQYALAGPHAQVVYNHAHDVFDWLPFAALVEGSVLVVHGGIGDGRWAAHAHQTDIDWLHGTDCRPVKALFSDDRNCVRGTQLHKVLMNIVWSDPITDPKPMEWQPHYRGSDRSADMIAFSAEVTREFCARNGVSLIIRGHEVAERGYELLHSGRLCTVFSARNYCGHLFNDAALVLLQPDADGHLQVKFKTLQHLSLQLPPLPPIFRLR